MPTSQTSHDEAAPKRVRRTKRAQIPPEPVSPQVLVEVAIQEGKFPNHPGKSLWAGLFHEVNRTWFNWRYLRSIGELQFLTRASSVMLILVPIVAAIWPAIRWTEQSYNDQMHKLYSEISSDIERLQGLLQTSSPQNQNGALLSALESDATRLVETLDSKLKHMNPRPLNETYMPLVWTLGFIAAVCVLFGQLLYQMFVPDAVRESRYLAFIREGRRDWSQTASLALRHDAEELVRRAIDRDLVWPEIRLGEECIPKLSQMQVTLDDDEYAVIEGAAAAEYALNGVTTPVIRFAIAGFYIVGIGILLYLLVDQTRAVLDITQWPWGAA